MAVLEVHADPGTAPWLPPADVLAQIERFVALPAIIHYHRRTDAQRAWSEAHRGRSLPVDPWSFRAWSQDGEAHLFVDPTETKQSATWLLLHELAHLDLVASPLLRTAYRSMARPTGYLDSDAGHEAHPEEQLANAVATMMLPIVGMGEGAYDRAWWRRRACAVRPDRARCG